jgi:TolB-like protein/Tfp pilus assembly protein PilF
MTERMRARGQGGMVWSRALAVAVPLCVCASVPAAAQCPDGTPPPCGARPARPVAAPAPNSVAVLYFDNQSRDTSDAYLADGLTEEITSRLGQLGRLIVTSHTTMERYRGAGSRPEPPALARTLRVAHLVNGSVRRSGHRIRVSVELLRPWDGVQVWADAYDRTDADLLAIEEEVARAVATAIAGRLLPREQAALAVRPTHDPEAYDHLLRGNFFLAQRTPAAARRAIAEYQAAASRDSAFALAFGRIGLAYALALDWGWPFPGLSDDSILALGTAAADRALQVDSQSTDGWLARALLRSFLYPFTFDGVLPALERATALDPRNAEAHHIYGVMLNTMGREREAAGELRRALDLDPLRAITWDNLAWVRRYQHRPEETAQCADSGLAADPQAYYLYADRATFRLTWGDLAGAQADADSAARTSPADYVSYAQPVLAALEAAKGDTVAARARLDRLVARLPDPAHPNYLTAWGVAVASLRMGDRERALSILEGARPRGLRVWFLTRDPGFDVIRDTPRFRAIVEQNRPPWADR